MTTDFIPDKAYLIKGKGIEQVKSEIKEWFYKNNFQVLEEGKNEIQGLKILFMAGYNIWLYIKLKSITGGTLIVFNNKYVTKMYEWQVYFSPRLRSHINEWPKNLVRFMSDRKELGLGYDLWIQSGFVILSIIIFLFFLDYNGFALGVTGLFFLLFFNLFSLYKLRQANLPEYKVEEYKGEVNI